MIDAMGRSIENGDWVVWPRGWFRSGYRSGRMVDIVMWDGDQCIWVRVLGQHELVQVFARSVVVIPPPPL